MSLNSNMTECLEEILERNYCEIIDDDITDTVLDYVEKENDIINKDVIFVKRLTKVAYNLIKKQVNGSKEVNISDKILNKLCDFNIIGILMVEESKDLTPLNANTLEAHFFAYAGDMVELQYKKSGDIKLAKRAFNMFKSASDKSKDVESIHHAVNLSKATQMARISYNQDFNFMPLNDLIDMMVNAGDAILEFNSISAGLNYEMASYYFEKKYCQSNDIKDLENSFKFIKKSAEIVEDIDKLKSANRQSFTANRAKDLANLSKNYDQRLDWAVKWFDHKLKSAHLSKQAGDNFYAAKAFSFASDPAKILSKMTRDLYWFDKAIEVKRIGAEMSENIDHIFSSQEYMFTGSLADARNRIEEDPESMQIAIDCCTKYIKFCYKYSDCNTNFIGRATDIVNNCARKLLKYDSVE
jgi:hypothetical protein